MIKEEEYIPSTAAQAPLFYLRNVKHTFPSGGGIEIDKLSIPSGCIVAILGDNGSGKTTLINLLGGLIDAEKTSKDAEFIAHIEGTSYDMLKSRTAKYVARTHFTYIFQRPHLLLSASAETNILLPLLNGTQAIPISEIRNRLIAFPLGDQKLIQRARILSAGERRAVSVARAIVRDATVMFADEATANLDSSNLNSILQLLKNWQRTRPSERTLIWVTNEHSHVPEFADKLIFLNKQYSPSLGINTGRIEPDHNNSLLRSSINRGSSGPNSAQTGIFQELRSSSKPATFQPTDQREELGVKQTASRNAAHINQRDTVKQEGAKQSIVENNGSSTGMVPLHLIPVQVALAEVFSASRTDRNPPPKNLANLLGQEGILRTKRPNNRASAWRRYAFFLLMLSLAGALIYAGSSWVLLFGLNNSTLYNEFAIATLVLGVAFILFAGRVVHFLVWCLRAFAKWKQVLILMAIFYMWIALSIGGRILDDSYVASISGSVDTSHFVVTTRRMPINEDRVAEYECRLRTRLARSKEEQEISLFHLPFLHWLMPPSYNRRSDGALETADLAVQKCLKMLTGAQLASAAPVVNGLSNDLSVFGRWSVHYVEVRRPQRDVCPSTGRYEGPSASVNVLAVDTETPEPLIAQMRYAEFNGKTLSDLRFMKGMGFSVASTLRSNDQAIIISRDLLAELGYSDYEQVGNYLCVNLFDWAKFQIAGVVDKLPKEERAVFKILVPRSLYLRQRKDLDLTSGPPAYDTAAIYVREPDSIKGYEAFFKELSGRNESTKTILPDAFEQIMKLLISKREVVFFMKIFAACAGLFSLSITILIAYWFISENEEPLCVMRAFGLKRLSLISTLLLQFIVLLFVAISLGLLLIKLGESALAQPLAAILEGVGVKPESVTGSLALWPEAAAITSITGLISCILAVVGWWIMTPWVGSRLKTK